MGGLTLLSFGGACNLGYLERVYTLVLSESSAGSNAADQVMPSAADPGRA